MCRKSKNEIGSNAIGSSSIEESRTFGGLKSEKDAGPERTFPTTGARHEQKAEWFNPNSEVDRNDRRTPVKKIRRIHTSFDCCPFDPCNP